MKFDNIKFLILLELLIKKNITISQCWNIICNNVWRCRSSTVYHEYLRALRATSLRSVPVREYLNREKCVRRDARMKWIYLLYRNASELRVNANDALRRKIVEICYTFTNIKYFTQKLLSYYCWTILYMTVIIFSKTFV